MGGGCLKTVCCHMAYTNIQLGQFLSRIVTFFKYCSQFLRVIFIFWIVVCWHFFENIPNYGHYKFANSSISSTFSKFIRTSVLYSTYFVLEILSFIISYSMSISSKDLYLVISVSVKERSKFLGDNSIFLFQTLTSRFIIATVYLDTVKLLFFYLLT